MKVAGARNADVFRASMRQGLAPTLALARPWSWIMWPPYAPDLSPTEPCWGKVKSGCAKRKRETAMRSTSPSPTHWRREPRRMPITGSIIVAMPYSSLKSALGRSTPTSFPSPGNTSAQPGEGLPKGMGQCLPESWISSDTSP